jgi:hypothetical protein
MNKPSSALVIIIPLLVIFAVIAGVFGYKTLMASKQAVQAPVSSMAAAPSVNGQVGKPQKGFTGTSTATSDLSADLGGVSADDGGVADFQSLQTEAAKL